jgi:NitT/TauT family transport system permease protein
VTRSLAAKRRPARAPGFAPVPLALLAALLALAGAFGPLASTGAGSLLAATGSWLPLLAVTALLACLRGGFWPLVLAVPVSLTGAFLPVVALQGSGVAGGWGFWACYFGFLLTAISAAGQVSLRESTADPPLQQRLRGFVPPAAVPFVLLLLWQGLVVGNHVPKGIFPSVTDVVTQLGLSWQVLLGDSYVTFVREVLFGLALGALAGFAAGVAIAFSSFLQRGFLPLAAAFGAVPIVGLAPVLGRAFGVDWESKAAVVVIVTFFPVVLNTVQGLVNVDRTKLELFHAYAARPWDTFFRLRLPNALPYIFNALKLGVVIAVISVIVAEFLIPGPPRGLGQRISLSARQGKFDVAFAAIVVSSVITIIMYAVITIIERLATSWHASFRGEESA